MINTIQRDEFFLIPFGIWCYFSTFQISLLFQTIKPMYVPLSLICMTIILIKEITYLKSYQKNDYTLGFIALFCFFIAYRLAQGTVMYSCFLLYCARHIDFKKLAKTCLIVCTASLITIVGCAEMGAIKNYLFYSHDGRIRENLGFLSCLQGPTLFFNIAALYIYLRKRKITIFEIIGLGLINQWFYYTTISRMVYALTIVLLVGSYLLKYIYIYIEKLRIVRLLMVLSFVLSLIFSLSISISYNYDSNSFARLNLLFENRLSRAYDSLNTYGISLFENDIEYIGNGMDTKGNVSTEKRNYVDNFYVQYLQRYGVLFFLALTSFYTHALHKANERKDYFALFILVLFAGHGIVDDLILTFFYNSFLFYISGKVDEEKELQPID